MSDVDVLMSDDLGEVLLRSRTCSPWKLKATIERSHPALPLQASAAGLALPALPAVALLDASGPLGLRWSAAARRGLENRADAKRKRPALKERIGWASALGPDEIEAVRTEVDPNGVLDPHQVTNVAVMTAPECFGICLFDEQGAGKTVSVIYTFDRLVQLDKVDRMLVVAPKSMVPEWQADTNRFMGSLYVCRSVSGSRAAKRTALRSGADVFITNFETVVALEKELAALLRTGGSRSLLVVDESFLVKTPDAQRTRALARVREWAERAFVLCGAPAPNSPHDVVEQVNLADFGISFSGIELPQDRREAFPVVQRTLEESGIFLRSVKREVLPDLPAKAMQVVNLPMEDQQRRAYEAALQSLVLDLRKTTDEGFRRHLTSFMARRTALLQICSNPVGVVPGYEEVPAKLLALDGLLKKWVRERGEKVVVWSFFTRSLDAVVHRYADSYGLVRYDGSTPMEERRAAVQRFQDDPATMVFVGNPAAAGAGLTLHAARLAIYESFSNQAAHYLQSLDRIHRRGQRRAVEYTFLVCENSLEESDLEALRDKEKAGQELLGDSAVPPVTRESMLAELLGAASS